MANLLTISRLIFAAAFAGVVAGTGGELGLAGFWILFALSAGVEITDMFDGIVARRQGTASVAGGILDPLADSLSRLTIYFSLALAGWVTIAVPLVMAGRDIVVAYTRIVQALAGGKTSARLSGKLKAILQGAGVFAILILAVLPGLSASQIELARWITAGVLIVVTAWSMIDYLIAASPAVRAIRRK